MNSTSSNDHPMNGTAPVGQKSSMLGRDFSLGEREYHREGQVASRLATPGLSDNAPDSVVNILILILILFKLCISKHLQVIFLSHSHHCLSGSSKNVAGNLI